MWQLWLCISQFRRFFSKILSLYSLHLKNSGIKKCNTLSHNYFFFFSQCKLTFWNSESIFHKPDFFLGVARYKLAILREKVQNSYFFPCNWKFTSRNSSFFLRILTFSCYKIKNYCDFLTHNFDFLAIASLKNLNCEICVEKYCEIKVSALYFFFIQWWEQASIRKFYFLYKRMQRFCCLSL